MKIFLDVESTGLNVNKEDITQLTMLLTDDNYIPVSYYNEFFATPKINAGVLEIQKLSFEEYVATHHKAFEDEAVNILDFLSKANYEFYAYNKNFDMNILKANLERAGKPSPHIKGIELMKRRQKLTENVIERGYNLDEILKYTISVFGNARGPHDARFDVICNMLIARDDKL